MNWFKRLCLFVFGVSGILSVGALALTWVGPWTTQLRGMLEIRWFFITLEVLVCVTGIGLLGCVLKSLFAPRNPKETIVADVDGGRITVTRAAIASQTRYVIERDGTCIASTVRVRVRKRGHVRVFARVRPRRPINVVEKGEELYAELQEGLAYVCGDTVQSIDVVFSEPEQIDVPQVRVETTETEQPAPVRRERTDQPQLQQPIHEPRGAANQDVTVRIGAQGGVAELSAPELTLEFASDQVVLEELNSAEEAIASLRDAQPADPSEPAVEDEAGEE